MEDWQEKFQAESKKSGRRSTVYSFTCLIICAVIYLASYTYIYLIDEKDINRFGMTWVFICMGVMWVFDIVGGLIGIGGVLREKVNDVLISLAFLLHILAIILNGVVIMALPSEDAMGEPSGLLGQEHYPPRCYYHLRSGISTSNDCRKLKMFATYIWCTFILFIIRVIVLISTKFSISYAKHGAVYPMYLEQPPTTYVIASNPYQYQYGYPGNGGVYYVQYPQSSNLAYVQAPPIKYTYAGAGRPSGSDPKKSSGDGYNINEEGYKETGLGGGGGGGNKAIGSVGSIGSSKGLGSGSIGGNTRAMGSSSSSGSGGYAATTSSSSFGSSGTFGSVSSIGSNSKTNKEKPRPKKESLESVDSS